MKSMNSGNEEPLTFVTYLLLVVSVGFNPLTVECLLANQLVYLGS